MTDRVKKGFRIGGFIGLGLSVTALIVGGISSPDILKVATSEVGIGELVVSLIAVIVGFIKGKKA